jgi:hypothetical protein
MALTNLVRLLGEALVRAVAPPPAVAALPTSGHYDALAKLIGGMPVSDLLALIDGRGTVDTDLALAEQAATLVAVAFPPAAITASEIKMALETLQFLLDAAGFGSSPIHITGGYRPITGGFAGARGHV